MKVRYIYSACFEIKTDDVLILTDPWFTQGAYYGSWYHFPYIDSPIDILSEPDIIYVSHIHHDHYDPVFLKKVFKKFGTKKVIGPDHEKNYLKFRANYDGIDITPTSHIKVGNTNIHVIKCVTGSSADIDSCLIVEEKGKIFLNLNDCQQNDKFIENVNQVIGLYNKDKEVDLMALSYTGAGPYPQTYYDTISEKSELHREALRKKKLFFDKYREYLTLIKSKYRLPSAGKYLLGGKLANLNEYRGVADATEVCSFDENAIVLSDFGEGMIDLNTYLCTSTRKNKYSQELYDERIKKIESMKLDYEKEIHISYSKINFSRILKKSYDKAFAKFSKEMDEEYLFVINIVDSQNISQEKYVFNTKKYFFKKIQDLNHLSNIPISEIEIDYRLLFGCLTSVYHWNNANVGSLFKVKRRPRNYFNRKSSQFLNFLCAV